MTGQSKAREFHIGGKLLGGFYPDRVFDRGVPMSLAVGCLIWGVRRRDSVMRAAPSSHVVCDWFLRCCAESSLEWLPSSEPVRSRVSDWFGFLCVKVSMEMFCAVVFEDAGIH